MALGAVLFAMASLLVTSCDKSNDPFSSEDTQTSNNESTLDSNSDELDDLAEVALNSQVAASGGRVASISDDRLNCDGTTITFSNVNADKTAGTVTIAFGPNGCTDGRGNVRKGSIDISWQGGKWYSPGATVSITLTNYSINGLGITGTRTLSCSGATGSLTDFTITWSVYADHTFTWPSNETATRKVNKIKAWHHTATEDTYTVSNGSISISKYAAEGTNRHGKEYTATISTPLVYLASCAHTSRVFLPVSGVKTLTDTKRSVSLTIDFGTGTCDNTYTVTVNGHSKTLQAKNDDTND
jgi:hypothetical protein